MRRKDKGWHVEIIRDSVMVRYDWLGRRKPDGWEASIYKDGHLVGYEWAATEDGVLERARQRKADVLELHAREQARKRRVL